MKGKSNLQSSSKVSEEEEGDYETVSSSTLEAIHALRILPAKPLQESEYADKRCLRPSGTTSPVNSQHTARPPPFSAASEDTAKAVSAPSSRAEDKQPVLSHEENTQPSSHLSNVSKSHKGVSRPLQKPSPQLLCSFACKIAPAATEEATTLPLHPLCGTLASTSPTSKVATMATAMLVLTILSPVQPRTAQPSYQSSHSAMASNLLSHEQPRKPQNIPQFISHWPHAPAHSRSAKLHQGQLQASLRRVFSTAAVAPNSPV
ncbi:hypothetical protein Q9233_010997 [Columba guinea]|nr:hypothetical protein Q9233_010997 [Columba guinea]